MHKSVEGTRVTCQPNEQLSMSVSRYIGRYLPTYGMLSTQVLVNVIKAGHWAMLFVLKA